MRCWAGRWAPAGGEYRLQAAIAALHDRAANAAQTDWPQIAGLYGLLEQVTGSPVVTLNRAVAVAMADGPEAGLALLDAVEEPLRGFYRLDAVRAHLLQMAGDTQGAITHFRAAASRDEPARAAVPHAAGCAPERG